MYKPLIEFGKDYPNIKIEISTGKPEDSLKSLSTGKTDIVIIDIEHFNQYKNIIFKEIIKNEYVFVMSKEFEEKNKVEIKDVSDLNKYSLILPKEESSADKVLKKYFENIDSHYELLSENMRKDLAVEGLGIAYVMKSLVEEELKTGELIEIKLGKPNSISKVGIATLKDEISSFATKKLVEYIMEYNKQ